jgi:hypothetical protein
MLEHRREAGQPQDQIKPWPSGETRLEVLKPAADDLLQRLPVFKSVNCSGERCGRSARLGRQCDGWTSEWATAIIKAQKH